MPQVFTERMGARGHLVFPVHQERTASTVMMGAMECLVSVVLPGPQANAARRVRAERAGAMEHRARTACVAVTDRLGSVVPQVLLERKGMLGQPEPQANREQRG